MKFDISGFTNLGSNRTINEDCIIIQRNVYNSGLYTFTNQNECFCFIADGVGGNPNGKEAADFILTQINSRITSEIIKSKDSLSKYLNQINLDLFTMGEVFPERSGMASTLVGICYSDEIFYVLNAGDSPLWILRDDVFFKVTEDHLLNPNLPNSPITSFFGGKNPELKISFYDNTLRELRKDDIILLCSDGLFKSLEQIQIKKILSNNQSVEEKANFLLNKSLSQGASDNISAIIIKVN